MKRYALIMAVVALVLSHIIMEWLRTEGDDGNLLVRVAFFLIIYPPLLAITYIISHIKAQRAKNGGEE